MPAGRLPPWVPRPAAWNPSPATFWKELADGRDSLDDPLAAGSGRAVACGAGSVGRGNAPGAVPAAGHPNRAFRLEPRRDRADARAVHHVRLPPRPAHLG